MVNSSTKDVPKLYALWLMPLPLIIHVAGQLLDADGEIFNRWIESESGFIENGTVLLLIPAAIFMLIAAKRFWQASTSVDDETSAVVAAKASGKLVAIWMLLGALGPALARMAIPRVFRRKQPPRRDQLPQHRFAAWSNRQKYSNHSDYHRWINYSVASQKTQFRSAEKIHRLCVRHDGVCSCSIFRPYSSSSRTL